MEMTMSKTNDTTNGSKLGRAPQVRELRDDELKKVSGGRVNAPVTMDMVVATPFSYIARKTGYEVTAILIGVLMGPLFEQYFLRALRVGQGDPTILFSSTLGNVLWVMVVLALILPWLRDRRRQGVLAQTVRAGHV
jgi:TctA family transporter